MSDEIIITQNDLSHYEKILTLSHGNSWILSGSLVVLSKQEQSGAPYYVPILVQENLSGQYMLSETEKMKNKGLLLILIVLCLAGCTSTANDISIIRIIWNHCIYTIGK